VKRPVKIILAKMRVSGVHGVLIFARTIIAAIGLRSAVYLPGLWPAGAEVRLDFDWNKQPDDQTHPPPPSARDIGPTDACITLHDIFRLAQKLSLVVDKIVAG
jgi:hypothetical protein